MYGFRWAYAFMSIDIQSGTLFIQCCSVLCLCVWFSISYFLRGLWFRVTNAAWLWWIYVCVCMCWYSPSNVRDILKPSIVECDLEVFGEFLSCLNTVKSTDIEYLCNEVLKFQSDKFCYCFVFGYIGFYVWVSLRISCFWTGI